MSNDTLEKLKKRLYRKGEAFREREIKSPLSPYAGKIKTYWEESPTEEEPLPFLEKPKSPFRRLIIVVISIILGFLIAGAAIYFLTGGPAVISSRNIEINLEGPTSIKGGELGNWQIVVTNKNRSDLELADLIIEYPQNSKPVPISQVTLKNLFERRSIGRIKSGETISEPVQAYLFGERDADRVFKFTLEYRPQGSNAILAATKEKAVRLLQSPIEISIELPKETNAGAAIDLEIEILSNAATVIKDLVLKMEYPAGFGYSDSDTRPASGDNIWRLGDLESNKKRTVKIKGILEGQDERELTFRAIAGPLDEKGEVIGYGFAAQGVILKKPFLSLEVKVNSQAGDIVVSPGADLSVDLEWQNTLPIKVYNAVIEIKIKGQAVNQRAIFVESGFYRSFDQALVWNKSSLPDLENIDPLKEGNAGFRFAILEPLPSEVMKQGNPVVVLDIEMRAERIAEEGKVEIKNQISKEIKIATRFLLSRRLLYYSGPFKNTGLLPPQVGKETTYTVIWSLTNSTSDVSDAVITAFLPSYVRWLNVIKPEDADVSYNQTTGEIIWRPGLVKRGTGISESPQELAFQISFLPNASQIGSQPVLVSETVLSAKDTFSGAFLRDVKSALTTYLDTDPQFKYQEAIVTQ